jgi:hypothetical protein
MRRLLVLLGIAAAVGIAAPIHADPTSDPRLDANFLDARQRAGVIVNNGASADNAAKAACAMMNQGQPEVGVVHSVTEQNRESTRPAPRRSPQSPRAPIVRSHCSVPLTTLAARVSRRRAARGNIRQ